MEKISIVGGAGFIGTRLARHLAERQVPFEIIDLRPSQSFPERSKIADIRDAAALRDALTGRVVIHLAAVHRDDVTDPGAYGATNVEGTRVLCAVAAEKGVERIVFTSSVAVYGFAAPGTGEAGPIAPFNAYGRTKFQAEEILRRWQSDAPEARALIIVRPTVVFGEGNRGNVHNLLSQIASGRFVMVGAGRNVKSMAYVGNVAAFLGQAAESPQRTGLYNYVDGPDFDMNALVALVRGRLRGKAGVGPRLPVWLGLALGRLADLVARLTGRRLPISAIRVRKFCADSQFASGKAGLDGFQAPVTLAEGLERTLLAEFIAPDPARQIFETE